VGKTPIRSGAPAWGGKGGIKKTLKSEPNLRRNRSRVKEYQKGVGVGGQRTGGKEYSRLSAKKTRPGRFLGI